MRLLAAAVLLATASGVLPGTLATSHADYTYDWMLATITAGPSGATQAVVQLEAEGQTTGTEPYVAGAAVSHDGAPYWGPWAQVVGFGPRRVSTSNGLRSVDMVSEPVFGAGFAGGYQILFGATALAPGETFTWLQFQTGSATGPVSYTTSTATGSVTVTTTQGSGSRVLTVGNPDADGYGANVDGLGAGTLSATPTVTTGIVGSAVHSCQACTGSWAAPDGRSGQFAIAGPQYLTLHQLGLGPVGTPDNTFGDAGFAGPAGTWTFGWQGVDDNRGHNPAEIVYAPVGDAWPQFTRAASGSCDGTLADFHSLGYHVVAGLGSPGSGEPVCASVEPPPAG